MIRDEGDLEVNPIPWAAEVRRLARASQDRHTAPHTQEKGRNDHDPLSGAVGFHKANLVQRLGRYTNPSSALQAIFDALPDEPIEPRALPEPPQALTGRLGNGEIKRAAVKVLAAATGPLPIADVHQGVERLLGRSVAKDSVGWCLAAGTRRRKSQFERVSTGVYRLSPR